MRCGYFNQINFQCIHIIRKEVTSQGNFIKLFLNSAERERNLSAFKHKIVLWISSA
jgi:hypothetical protein